MYTQFFGLTKKPFSLSPDPSFLYLSPKHKKALTTLRYGLVSQASITVITGDIGSGKTTLIMTVLEKVENQCTVGLITNTHSTFGDLLTWVLAAFNIPHESKNKAERYQIFTKFLADEQKKQRRVILIVDEAQNMDIETLEELRLLSNINIADQVKLQMILVGQTELVEKLNKPELIQFAQRISIEYHLQPLNFDETQKYIAHRLVVAGGNPAIFNEAALAAVYFYTDGIPRLINNICDLAMVFAFASESRTIGWKTIIEVVNERKTGGIRRFKGTISTEPSMMDRATEAERLRRAILDKTKVDISRSL